MMNQQANFPNIRMRRLRGSEMMRSLVQETRLSIKDFVYPMFVCPGSNIKDEINAMPGQFRYSVDQLVEACKEVRNLGIPAIMLFGIPEEKDESGSASYNENGIVQKALRALAKEVPGLLTIADVCLCAYTTHGHCGIIEHDHIHNDKSLEVLSKQALSFAQAGAGMIAPSDMMDGRIAAIRNMLDANQFENTGIMAYSAKFASGFYGPFRDAADSAPQFGDRRTYQMDPANSKEALREIELDIQEGADIVMVKPALAYLDIIRTASESFNTPVAAYNVSGEYSMIKAAAANGWIDHDRVMLESLTSIKRAGAKIILSYFAKEIAPLINGH